MTWSLLGLGEYELQDSDDRVPPDRAVDVYLDEWVETCSFTWELLNDGIAAHRRQPFRMIQPTFR